MYIPHALSSKAIRYGALDNELCVRNVARNAVCIKVDGTFTGLLNMVRMLKIVDLKLH